jgi:hypothetical protein
MCSLVAYVSDLTQIRLPFVLFGLGLAVTGLAILMSVHHSFAAQFGALCLVMMGAFTSGICVVCWYVMNLHGHLKRSIGTAWITSFANTGGFLATFTFIASDAPRYTKGYSICMGAICFSILSTIAYTGLIMKARRKRSSGSGISYSL